MDVRYNIIQWVHRYTRGWSYGAAIADPRTGEIIKGNVTLGSLRARQDYLIAEALLSPYGDSTIGRREQSADNPMLQMVLARIRQLSAHETGHTLGLAHNFAASSVTQGDSVMDYPHPYMTLDSNSHIDLSHAYTAGIGDWDKVAINYGYRESSARTRPPTSSKTALDKILTDADHAGQVFITDEDARPFGSAHPHAHLWDNGTDPAAELDRVLAVRAAALKNFGEDAIKPGTPMARLEQTLVPLYLFHRYQTEAAIKEISGLDYRYNLRGDGLADPKVFDPAQQKKAIDAGAEDAQTGDADAAGIDTSHSAASSSGLSAHARVVPFAHRAHLRSDRRRRIGCGPDSRRAAGPCPRKPNRRISHAGSSFAVAARHA